MIEKGILSGMVLANPVPIPPDRLNDGAFAKFLAKGVNVDLESFASGLRPFAPDQRKDLLVREGPIGMPNQDAQNGKFLVGKWNITSIEKDFVTGYIDDQPVELGLIKREHFVTDCFALSPTEDGTNS